MKLQTTLALAAALVASSAFASEQAAVPAAGPDGPDRERAECRAAGPDERPGAGGEEEGRRTADRRVGGSVTRSLSAIRHLLSRMTWNEQRWRPW